MGVLETGKVKGEMKSLAQAINSQRRKGVYIGEGGR